MPPEPQGTQILRLTTAVESLTRAVENIGLEVRDQDRRHTEITTQLSAMAALFKAHQGNFDGLTRVVRDGNGQPSLLVRVSVIESTLKTVSEDVKGLAARYDTAVTTRALTRAQVWGGVLGLAVSSVMSLGAILAQLLKG